MEEVYDNRSRRGRICTINRNGRTDIVVTMASQDGFVAVITGGAGTGLVKDDITNAYPIGLPGRPNKKGTFQVIFNKLP